MGPYRSSACRNVLIKLCHRHIIHDKYTANFWNGRIFLQFVLMMMTLCGKCISRGRRFVRKSCTGLRWREQQHLSDCLSSLCRLRRCRHHLRTKLRRRWIRSRPKLGSWQERRWHPLGPPLLPQGTGDGYYAGEEMGDEEIVSNAVFFSFNQTGVSE